MKQLILSIILFSTYSSIAQPAWQQRVDTKIDVQLDDKKHFLHAYEELSYTNNSPDTLRFIYIHLWPNAYKNDRTPFERQQAVNGNTSFYYSKPKAKGYIDSLQFTVDGIPADHFSSEKSPDVARIDLPKALLPGHTIKITTPFLVKIPHVFSRMGHSGQAYYISQWFPKPAVYDQKGWHPISYLDQGEFFSEYGSYDVSITLPANYVLLATGNCTDEKENAWMDELSKKDLPTQTYKKHNDTIPKSSLEMKTVHFHEDNIHDFAWFADKRLLVRKDTVYSPGNNLLVTTWAAFMPSYWKQWQKVTGYLKETVKHYGKWVGPYQYKTIKAVLGDLRAGGGMEYPTVTVIDKASGSGGGLKTVIVHEAGHNWFYGMLGSNERDHAWMDEGINTFYEQKTSNDLNHDSAKVKKRKLDESLIYYERAATHIDQAIDQTSANFEKLNYGLDVYYKTALSLNWLEKYMGTEDFEKGMHDYYSTWHFHHPYPEDFKACMQRNTSKPIGWFVDTVLTANKKIDFKVVKAHVNGANTTVTVRNNTGVAAPVLIDACYKDSITASAWTAPFSHTTTLSIPTATWRTLQVDDVIPDGKADNDVYRRHALSHHFGLQFRPIAGLNLAHKDRIFVSPAVAYNQYDGIMAGLLIHDLTLPENRFRYALAPLYSFETQSLVGAGSVGYVWYPESVFKEIMLRADGKTFHGNEFSAPAYALHLNEGYSKVAPSLTFTFNQHDALSPVIRSLMLKGYYITEQNVAFSADSLVKPSLASQNKVYGLVRYKHSNNRTYNPFNYTLEGQMGADFAKLSAEGNLRINYNTPRKSLYIRAFLGKFFAISSDLNAYSRYELNTTYSGLNDYLYDGTYLGRNAMNDCASQQISMQEGGFKVPVFNNADRSDNWMATVNLETDLPLKRIPLMLFLDAGLIPNQTPTLNTPGSTTLLYDGGVKVQLLRNVVSIYIPIIMSNDFQNYLNNTFRHKNAFAHSISFTLHLQNINWLKLPATAIRAVTN